MERCRRRRRTARRRSTFWSTTRTRSSRTKRRARRPRGRRTTTASWWRSPLSTESSRSRPSTVIGRCFLPEAFRQRCHRCSFIAQSTRVSRRSWRSIWKSLPKTRRWCAPRTFTSSSANWSSANASAPPSQTFATEQPPTPFIWCQYKATLPRSSRRRSAAAVSFPMYIAINGLNGFNTS